MFLHYSQNQGGVVRPLPQKSALGYETIMHGQRRSIAFGNLDEVAADIRNLQVSGYSAHGNWNLSQACGHLNDWMRFPMDGYPRSAAPIRAMLWLMKVTVGRKQLKRILTEGFSARTPTMPQTVHAVDAKTDAAAVEQLVETINRFKDFDGPLAVSPVFGELTPDEAVQLQLRHCAHHLSFLTPNA